MTTSHRITLASRPTGEPTPADFGRDTVELPPLAEGELLLKIRWLSLDPYMRGRMSDAKSYVAPIEVGAPMEGGTVGEVVESRAEGFAAGDLVVGMTGWQTYAVVRAKSVRKLDPAGPPPSTALGVLGMPGFTAWGGLLEIGRPREGETVVVAAATGPVGSAVGQIARIKGARAIGIAGGAEKFAHGLNDLGLDVMIDHRAPDFREQLKAAAPKGIDVYFENVGGKVFDAVLQLMNLYGRIPVCGLIADYNATGAPEGPDRRPALLRAILVKSLTVRGFIQWEFQPKYRDFLAEMGAWVADGRVRYREDVVEGLEAAPEAFIGLLKGKNFGKLVVKVA